jgi:hypothetical protein
MMQKITQKMPTYPKISKALIKSKPTHAFVEKTTRIIQDYGDIKKNV